MDGIVEFVLACVAEDEIRSSIHTLDCDLVAQGRADPTFGWECSCGVPARVLAGCEAKRRQVARLQPEYDGVVGEPAYCMDLADDLLRLLALPYADRPGYDPAWAPEQRPTRA